LPTFRSGIERSLTVRWPVPTASARAELDHAFAVGEKREHRGMLFFYGPASTTNTPCAARRQREAPRRLRDIANGRSLCEGVHFTRSRARWDSSASSTGTARATRVSLGTSPARLAYARASVNRNRSRGKRHHHGFITHARGDTHR